MTQLSSITNLAACGTGSVPATSVSLPIANVSDHERFEGMLVEYDQTLTATEVFNLGRFGEVSLSGAGRLYNTTAVALPGAPAQAVAAQNARSRIILDDANNQQNIDPTRYPTGGLSATNTLRVGDTLDGLTGVLEFRFSAYRIQPVGAVNFIGTNLRSTAPAPVGGNLKIASFNVLNYFNGDGLGGGFPTSRGAESTFEFDRQEAKIVSALKAIDADIVGLMEIENDGGANSALSELVGALNAATAPGTYAFVDTGVIGTDEIKVALIYKSALVAPVGTWDILTTADDPRFIDTRNRPTLAQTFRQISSGQVITVAVNHLKSKGSGCGGAPDDQPDTGGGNCNGTRTAAAEALADWLGTDPTGSGDPDVLIIGDLNSYTFETPIQALEAGGFENLVRTYGGLTAYSYVFNGESGYLDHALGNASMAAQVTGVNEWHINPDEPTVLDYNTNFKSANHVTTLYDPGPYRSSDHDPVIVGIQLNHAPTADAGGPYTVAEGGSVTVTATGTDADDDTVTFAWDLDNDGAFDDAVGATASFSAAAIDGPATTTIRVRASDGTAGTIDSAIGRGDERRADRDVQRAGIGLRRLPVHALADGRDGRRPGRPARAHLCVRLRQRLRGVLGLDHGELPDRLRRHAQRRRQGPRRRRRRHRVPGDGRGRGHLRQPLRPRAGVRRQAGRRELALRQARRGRGEGGPHRRDRPALVREPGQGPVRQVHDGGGSGDADPPRRSSVGNRWDKGKRRDDDEEDTARARGRCGRDRDRAGRRCEGRRGRSVRAGGGECADDGDPDPGSERLPRGDHSADRLGGPARTCRHARVRRVGVPRHARAQPAGDEPEHAVRLRR